MCNIYIRSLFCMSNCVRFKVCKGLVVLTKKDAQHESCKLNFIWGKMRTAAQEITPQIALRSGSKGRREVSIYVILVKRKYMKSTTIFCRRFSASHRE